MARTPVFYHGFLSLMIVTLLAQEAETAVYRPAGSSSALINDINAANASVEDDIIDLGGFIYDFAVDCKAAGSCAGDNYATFSAAALPFIHSGAGKLSIINGTLKRLTTVGGSPNTNFFRFFVVNSGANLSLFNITLEFGELTGGADDRGGAIYNLGDLSVENSVLVNNTATGLNGSGGGAIYNQGSTILENDIIAGNTIINGGGGGVFNSAGAVALNNCTVSDNIIVSNDGSVRPGGGLLNLFGTMNITNSTISNNQATSDGGAIYNNNFMVVLNSTIYENSLLQEGNPFNRGGGIFNTTPGILITKNNTIVGNLGGTGGGIYNDATISGLISNIVAANIATISAQDIFSSGSIIAEGFNLISDTTGNSIVDGVNDDIVVTDLNKLFLGPLQDNGGRTFTVALLPGSLAINNGNNSDALEFDQRGKPYERVVCSVPDIGAYELQVCDDLINRNPRPH